MRICEFMRMPQITNNANDEFCLNFMLNYYKATDFQKYLKEQLKDKELKKLYDEYRKQLEIAYYV